MIENNFNLNKSENLDKGCFQCGSNLELSKRIAKAALPFVASNLSRVPKMNKVTSISLDIFTIASSRHDFMQTTVSTISIAATIFEHPIGDLISTAHALMGELVHLSRLFEEGLKEELLIALTGIVNNSLTLALCFHERSGLKIASLAIRVCLEIYYIHREIIHEDRRIEGMGHVLMVCMRLFQLLESIKAQKKFNH